VENNFIISAVMTIFSKDRVLFDYQSILIYGKDLTDVLPPPHALCVVFPQDKNELVSLVHFANEHRLSLVPSGGRTGYSGGAVAKQNDIIVSFEKMNHIVDFNAADKTLHCEAGVTLKAIQDYAKQLDLFYPVDFASAAECQIGGNIATNAGGLHVIRYGSTRQWVMGLTVITGRGDILGCNKGLVKNATGYDFRHLFIGSEGTLGFITHAILKLTALPKKTKVILFSVSNNQAITILLSVLQQAVSLIAFEFFCHTAMQCVMQAEQIAFPFQKNTDFYGLFEYESDDTVDLIIEKILQDQLNKNNISEILMSHHEKEANHLWRYRKGISRSLKKYFPYKFDLAVLPSTIFSFMRAAADLLRNKYAALETVWFGHVGDGNLHVNVLKPETVSEKDFAVRCAEISETIYAVIQHFNGSICAEHGVGLLKKPYLHYSKSDSEIQYMRGIKNIFDPNHVMNPGKLI